MVLAQHYHTIVHLFRLLFTVIDRVVYWALMEIYNLMDQISKINVFSDGTISEFGERIYTIIGVLMLFKLAFSIITYIIDPDKLTDSKKGFSAIVKNIVIMLVLMVTVPLIFRYAMGLQYVVVSDNTIGRLITGKEGATYQNAGDNIAVAILSSFIYPDSGILPEGSSVTECSNYSEECETALEKYHMSQYYNNAYKGEKGYNGLLAMAASTERMGDDNFVITYNVILSTLVGGFTAWILLMFCIDLAVRIIKLGFLQMIAPIPIVTYMDDGGQGVFKKWVKVCTSTYADLFVRLAAINFAIFIITSILIADNGQNALGGNFKMCEWSFEAGTLNAVCNEKPGIFIRLFLILGTLMFAKQLPKLIEEITGLKLASGFTLNPIKKMQEVPLLGGIGAKALGVAGRSAKTLGGLGLGLAGMGVKTAGGALAGSAFGQWVGHGVGVAKNWATGTDAYQYARDLKGDASNYMKKIGGTAAGRKVGAAFSQIGADVRGNAMPGFISKMGDKKIKALEERISNRKSVEDAVKSAYDAGKFNSDDADVRALKLREQQLATMKQNAPSRTFVDDHGVTHELSDSDYNDVLADYNQNIFDMENAIAKDKKALMRTLEDRVASGELRNDDVSRALQKEVAYDSANGFEHYDTSEDRHSASDGGTINGKEVAGWKSELAEAKDKRIAQQEAAKANK